VKTPPVLCNEMVRHYEMERGLLTEFVKNEKLDKAKPSKQKTIPIYYKLQE